MIGKFWLPWGTLDLTKPQGHPGRDTHTEDAASARATQSLGQSRQKSHREKISCSTVLEGKV